MAWPKVTAAALQKARELAAECGERPVVVVTWHPPTHNNQRGRSGETVWIRTPGHWSVDVADLKMVKGLESPIVEIGGLNFLFVEPEPNESPITIDCADGKLVVREAI